MNTQECIDYCRLLPGASETDFGPPANILVFQLDAKRFAYFKTSEPEQWRFSLRVSPTRFIELTDQAGIKPARYMHRFHWISIVNLASVDPDYLKELIHGSYQQAFTALSKKRQAELRL